MLRFLSSLFASSAPSDARVTDDLLRRATERAVDGSDPRLRALPGYRKQLRKPVEAAVRHAIALVDRLPEPVDISAEAYRNDARLRAFFVSPEHLRKTIGHCPMVSDCLRREALPEDGYIYGLLTMTCSEKNTLGMALHGDTVRRDVAQVVVNFSDHMYLGPSDSEATTRYELMRRAFDFLIEKALQGIVAARGKKAELEQQRQLLQRKLIAMDAGNWGLEPVLAAGQTGHPDLAALEDEIQAVETELLDQKVNPHALEHSLEQLGETLGDPAQCIDMRGTSLEIDQMSIKRGPGTNGPCYKLDLTELFFPSGNRRIVLLGRFPVRELPPRNDFLSEAERLLGR
jgi:hypothetical protein